MYHYDVVIHMRYDPDDLNVDEFELEAENIEAAKQWIKENKKIGIINYYVIDSAEEGSGYYCSADEPDFVDYT